VRVAERLAPVGCALARNVARNVECHRAISQSGRHGGRPSIQSSCCSRSGLPFEFGARASALTYVGILAFKMEGRPPCRPIRQVWAKAHSILPLLPQQATIMNSSAHKRRPTVGCAVRAAAIARRGRAVVGRISLAHTPSPAPAVERVSPW